VLSVWRCARGGITPTHCDYASASPKQVFVASPIEGEGRGRVLLPNPLLRRHAEQVVVVGILDHRVDDRAGFQPRIDIAQEDIAVDFRGVGL